MAEASTMTVPAVLQVSSHRHPHHHHQYTGRQAVSILAISPTLSASPSTEAGATVYVGAPSNSGNTETTTASCPVWRTEVNQNTKNSDNHNHHHHNPSHVVKIKINPELDNTKVISTVNLTSPNDHQVNEDNDGLVKLDSCVRISVNDIELEHKPNAMVQKIDDNGPNRTCFYYDTYQNPLSTMVMSSGQCSPSDTLDSGTCSDLDGTPPPLPKKKNSSTVHLGGSDNQHKRTGSLTSSGAEIDSDDNESNISCDSLNSRELAARVQEQDDARIQKDLEATAGQLHRINLNNNDDKNFEKIITQAYISPSQSSTSSLSKSSSTPRVRSPNPLANGKQQSPVVKECTYEERKRELDRIEQENAAAEHYANYKRDNGTKYVYEDDRFYKFHINELDRENCGEETVLENKGEVEESEEYFAGYKIMDREAIRSAKGTVRGVKNRVRAGIATFLQNPSSKNYKQKDAGKVVVYTTSMRVVRKTTIACVKMLRILGTHMVQCEKRDLFISRHFQTELKERLGIEEVDVPQLFIDGQYIGDADAVERLNESGELRTMLKPYKCPGKREVCSGCGDAGIIPCPVCNGSKKSPRWNSFMNEFVGLRCMNCDEVGLTSCPQCRPSS